MDDLLTLSDRTDTQVTDEKDLAKLSSGERAWLWRYRRISDSGRRFSRIGPRLSVAEAAALLGVRDVDIRATEQDTALPAVTEMVMRAIRRRDGEPLPPTRAEGCALARRRSGLRPLEVCAQLGDLPRYRGQVTAERNRGKPPVSKVTIGTWEREGDSRLIEFWEERGYSFAGLG